MTEERPRLLIAPDAAIPPDVEAALLSVFNLVQSSGQEKVDLVLGPPSGLETRLEAIRKAGQDLTAFESSDVRSLNLAQRLHLLEEKVVRHARDLLGMDHFEIRLLDRRSGQLELVIAERISPLKIGEVLLADEHDNGICGHVVASGTSYVCGDVAGDPLYRPGIKNGASSLTVPLWLHDRVIGVFNAESEKPDAFDDDDRRLAETFGKYIAIAMHMLDLLVVERYTTSEELSRTMLSEFEQPLADLVALAERARTDDPSLADQIATIAVTLRHRLDTCTAGPQTIIDADRVASIQRHPELEGRSVLVADDEDVVRHGVVDVLKRLGCSVTDCVDGDQTITALKEAHAKGNSFDLVISDIRMPGHNGYEVFRTARDIDPSQSVILITTRTTPSCEQARTACRPCCSNRSERNN